MTPQSTQADPKEGRRHETSAWWFHKYAIAVIYALEKLVQYVLHPH